MSFQVGDKVRPAALRPTELREMTVTAVDGETITCEWDEVQGEETRHIVAGYFSSQLRYVQEGN